MHYNRIPSLSNRLLQAPSAIWIVTTSFLSHNWSINWQTVRVRAKLSLGFIAQTVSQPPWYVTCIGWSHPLWFFSPQLESWSFPSTENMYHANKYIFHHIIRHGEYCLKKFNTYLRPHSPLFEYEEHAVLYFLVSCTQQVGTSTWTVWALHQR